jgi:hypothetical protein
MDTPEELQRAPGSLNPSDSGSDVADAARRGAAGLDPVGFNFDCDTLDEFPVTLKIGGVDRKFALVELTGVQRDKYLNFTGGKMKYRKGKPEGLANFDNLEAFLISLSLQPRDNKPALTPQQINAIGSKISGKLADKVREMSGLEQDKDDEPGVAAEEAAKND